MYVLIHVYLHTCVCVHVCSWMHICAHIHFNKYVHTCVFLYLFQFINIYLYIYIYKNICYIYIYRSCQPGLGPALHYAIRAGPALSLSLSLLFIYIHIYHDIGERDIRRLRLDVCIHSSTYAHPVTEQSGCGACMQIRSSESGDPESSQGPSDCCKYLQSDALPTELSPG